MAWAAWWWMRNAGALRISVATTNANTAPNRTGFIVRSTGGRLWM